MIFKRGPEPVLRGYGQDTEPVEVTPFLWIAEGRSTAAEAQAFIDQARAEAASAATSGWAILDAEVIPAEISAGGTTATIYFAVIRAQGPSAAVETNVPTGQWEVTSDPPGARMILTPEEARMDFDALLGTVPSPEGAGVGEKKGISPWLIGGLITGGAALIGVAVYFGTRSK